MLNLVHPDNIRRIDEPHCSYDKMNERKRAKIFEKNYLECVRVNKTLKKKVILLKSLPMLHSSPRRRH